MAKEKFGKFILLEEIDATALGHEYRAAKLGASGLEKIVSLVRLRPALAASAEVAKSLLDQVKAAAQIQNPNVVKIFGIGKVETSYYICYEFLEGKSLAETAAIVNRNEDAVKKLQARGLASLRRGIDCLSGCWRVELDQAS